MEINTFESIHAVIFDMDGVLIDSEPIQYRLEKDLFSELGFDLSEQEHRAFLGINNFEMISSLKKRFGFTGTIEETVRELRRRYLRELKGNGIPVIDGVTQLLSSLESAGLKLALASSAPREQIDLVINQSCLGRYFSVLVSGDEVERSKPDPAVFLKAARLLNVGASACCVIEDSVNGVSAARNAGMRCVGFQNGCNGDHTLDGADWVVESMNEAGKIIITPR